MRLAVHSHALLDVFGGVCDPIATALILSSRIAVTTQVLQQYQAALGSHPGYQAWFTSAQMANRLTIHLPQLAPAVVRTCDAATDGYGTPAYFAGSKLVAEAAKLSATENAALVAIGIIPTSPHAASAGTVHGDNPLFTIVTKANGNDGFGWIDRLVIPEQEIVIYDKYINAASLELLQHIASKMGSGGDLKVYHSNTTGSHLLTDAQIVAGLSSANAAINLTCKTVSPAFAKQEHDRYIFLGKRLQIVFTVGLDCFGVFDPTAGRRYNRQSKIMVFDCFGGRQLHIEDADLSICTVTHVADL